ncbi:hypothetical protein ABH923_003222 [Leifsonia sp. EB41]|uniref:hypothetical protein n=1 Tax=Leifsonia sp. EB41 TaxID=3156260 RepID=UPI003511D064
MAKANQHKHAQEGGYSAFVIKSSEGRRTGVKAEDARRYESQRDAILRGTQQQKTGRA